MISLKLNSLVQLFNKYSSIELSLYSRSVLTNDSITKVHNLKQSSRPKNSCLSHNKAFRE
jgi:hypothetical protein